jgi:hypothetical protein
MIIQIYHKKLQQTVLVDNNGQKHKDIKITGDKQLSEIVDRLLNREIHIPIKDMYPVLKRTLPDDCFINENGKIEIYKAHDNYMEYFVNDFCNEHPSFVATIIRKE